ncbi:MAG TPA: filamentous hemagglutinin N-terminal domain-containing protein, partial [Parasulfuritortus sp.]
MNQQRYRLIFDRTRGMLVAVAEIVTSHGKATGQTRPGRLRGVEARSFSLRSLTFSLWGMLGLVTLASGATTTQVTVDPSAPISQQPTLLSAPNGVPLINIQTPNAAGVSRNTYTQFDVGQNGAILNNSRVNVQTQLGGWVQGNPWMAAGTAKVILNEVNSNNPSLLQGYVEVAGDRAQVVIANPAGISCSGCGFINASRATLTTGTAVLNAGGGLDGYRVQGGTITVDGAGLDTSTADYTDLIARAVQVNAGIWANQLRVTAGANQVDAGNASATPIPGTGAAPTFGIDVAQLGGMYAGKIVLVGTEAGVGVRNAGQIGASAGDVVVTADGQLVNSGRITSSGQTTLQSNSDVTNSGTLYAQGNLTLTSAGTLTNSGFLAAQGDATLSANQVASGALLGAGIQSDGTLASSGTLAVTAAQGMASTGQNLAGGDLHLSGATLDLAGSRNQAQNITLAASQGNIDLIGATVAANQSLVALAAQSLLNTNGVLAANGDIAIGAAGVDNHQGTIASTLGNLVIGTGSLDNSNGILATSDQGGDVVLTVGSLDNTAGQIGSGRDIVLQANSLTGDGRIISGRDLSLSLPGDYTYTAANLFKANRNMALQFGGAFTNQGALEAVGTLGLAAASLDNQAGADINSAQTVLAVTGNVLNDGRIEGDTLAIQAGDITNDATLIGGNLALSANTLTNTGSGALIAATNDIQLWIANALTNQGGATIYSLGDLSIGANSQRDANGNLVNNTPTLLNDSSTIESGGNMEIAVDNLTNQRLVQTTQVDQGTTTNVRGNTVLWQWSGSPVTPDDFVPQVTTLSDGTTITSYSSAYYQYWNRALNIRGAYTAPAVVTIDASNIASNDTSGQVVTLNTPLFFGAYNFRIFQWDDYSTPMTNPSSWYASSIYYQSLVPINGGTQYQLTFYPGQTANSLQPSELRSAGMTDCGELWELQRTDVVHTFQDQITQLAAPSRILAGGNLQIGLGGTLSNQQAQIAAGGSIAVNGATTDSGSVSGSNVVNTSVLLNKTQLVSSSSYFWTWSTLNGGENRVANITYPTTTQTTVTGSVDGTITAGQSVSINAGSISNLNVAGSAAPSGGSTAANAFASSGSPTLPSNGLYTLNTSPEQHYLVATDPRFANYSTWLSSDYMLNALALDPATIQKRLGDGFYEQRLVEDQVAQLTGSRYLTGFTSDSSEYQALMDAGVNFAKQYNLVPGVALTDTQMAALTSDIVWLVDKTVTLPGGSTQTVLAPQIYLAHTNPGDVQPSGALIAAQNITLQATDTLTNVGTVKGDTVTLYANDLANKGGTVAGATSVTAIANHDLVNDGGTFQGGRIALVAGNDLTFKAGNLAATGDAVLAAGRNLDIDVTTHQASASSSQDGHTSSVAETTNTGSTLTAGHDLTLQSGGDTTITASTLSAGNTLTAQAQGNLIVQSATDTKSLSYQTSGDHYQYGGSQTDTTVVGSTLTAGHGVNLTAQQGTALIESSK